MRQRYMHGGDFCGYSDRTAGRWGTALLPAEDGIGNIHELKMAKGSEHMVSLKSGNSRC
jgi:hypothetical protein